MTQALILVDIQNDYFDGGLWPVENMAHVAKNAAKVLAAARARGDLIIHVYHEAVGTHAPFFQPGTKGAEIHPSVAPRQEELLVRKTRPNSFHNTALEAHLDAAGVTQITLVGATTQLCIDATARAARDLGYQVTLVANALGAKSQSFGGTTLSAAQVQAAFLTPLRMSYVSVV
ncbi:MAG: cysteine hydrolase family protein [Pseudomonadota bacterium]